MRKGRSGLRLAFGSRLADVSVEQVAVDHLPAPSALHVVRDGAMRSEQRKRLAIFKSPNYRAVVHAPLDKLKIQTNESSN